MRKIVPSPPEMQADKSGNITGISEEIQYGLISIQLDTRLK